MGKLARLKPFLRCPKCRGPLVWDAARCQECHAPFTLQGDRVDFSKEAASIQGDWLDSLKERVRGFAPWLYPFLIHAVSPVYTGFSPRQFVRSTGADATIFNLGAGTTDLAANVINVDFRGYATVNLVCSAHCVPVVDGCADAVVCDSVLEHVPNPAEVIQEMKRILKPGGKVYCFVPFMQGVHGSPYDFYRWTAQGLREAFREWEIVEVKGSGPTSGMVWIVQQWLALLFSFGIRPLYRVLSILVWVLSPLKYFDLLLNHHPDRMSIASGYLILAKKR